MSAPPGECLAALNYEHVLPKGYRRIDGSERFDGQPAPSQAVFHVIRYIEGDVNLVLNMPMSIGARPIGGGATEVTADLITVDIIRVNEGDEVEGQAGNLLETEGILVLDNIVEIVPGNGFDASQEFFINDGGIEAFIAKVDPDFPESFELQSSSDEKYWEYMDLTREARRAKILAVPGEGPVRGVYSLGSQTFAFRDKVGGASAGMYIATPTGWVEHVPQSTHVLYITNGDNEPAIGDTIQEVGTPANSAEIVDVQLHSGDWDNNDAQATLVLTAVTGTFDAGALIENVAGALVVGTAFADGPGLQAAGLPAGGHYEFIRHNFYAGVGTDYIYLVNGVGKAQEWTGTVLNPIDNWGMGAEDKPTHWRDHGTHLYLGYRGGSTQRSVLGDPLWWDGVFSAAEVGHGDEITGFSVNADGNLIVLGRNKIKVIQGQGDQTATKDFVGRLGAVEWSVATIGEPWFMDDRGITSLSRAYSLGDFRQNILSQKVDTFVRENKTNVACCMICRNKNQYRIFFKTGTALFMTFEGKRVVGTMSIAYRRHVSGSLADDIGELNTFFCADSTEDDGGFEHQYAGGDDGFVYELDAGTSFDGFEIEATLFTHYHPYGDTQRTKRFRGVDFELKMEDGMPLSFKPNFSYGDPVIPTQGFNVQDIPGAGGFWEFANWDQFAWGGQIVSKGRNRIEGSGTNMALVLYSKERLRLPHTIQGATVSFSTRGLLR